RGLPPLANTPVRPHQPAAEHFPRRVDGYPHDDRTSGAVRPDRGWCVMAVRVVEPKGKGALLLDAHPGGCEATVEQAAAEVTAGAVLDDPAPTVLIIGTSSGYGQAITIAGLVGMRMSGIGLCEERAATDRRTASAGWYRVRAMAALARRHGARFEFHNGDCYATDTKRTVLRRLAEKYGKIDYLIYSVAAPRRTDP